MSAVGLSYFFHPPALANKVSLSARGLKNRRDFVELRRGEVSQHNASWVGLGSKDVEPTCVC